MIPIFRTPIAVCKSILQDLICLSKGTSTTPRIIGLIGYKRVGKTATAKILASKGYTLVAFADKLKSVVADVFLLDESSHVFDNQAWKDTPHPKLGGKTPVEVYQWLGTEGFRHVTPDVWVRYAVNKVRDFPLTTKVVFTDIRFPEEAEAVKQLGGTLIVVRRPNVGKASDHKSESLIEDLVAKYKPLVLVNNGNNFSELEKALDKLLQ